MHIEQAHALGQAEATRRLDACADELLSREFPAGVKVSGLSRTWSGGTMPFSFTAKKGFFGAKISGVIRATDQLVTLDAELPGIVTALVPEEKIRGELQAQLARVLAA